MRQKGTTLLVAHDPHTPGSWVTDHIPRDAKITVGTVLDSLSVDSEALRVSDADLLVVACSDDSDDALALVQWWVDHRRGRPVVVLCQNSPNGFVQRAFAAGADDLVVLDGRPGVSGESARSVEFALQKAIVRRAAPAIGESSLGTMICVLGPKGGVGKTVTCCNLGATLAERRKAVALVDLDLQFGDVALTLGVRPESTIYDLMVSGGSLDAEKAEAYLTVHPTGLRVLAAPVRPDQGEAVTAEFVADVIAALRTAYEYVLVDTPPSLTPPVISAIDTSTYVCILGMLDALSLKNTRLGLETLELMGYPSERIRLVLNRANSNVGITGHDVVSILGQPPNVLIPSTRELARSVNQGEPIVLTDRRSEAAKAFGELADIFAPPNKATGRRRNRMLRGRSRN